MNPKILKFAQMLAKRPSDTTISILRISIGLILIAIFYIARANYALDLPFDWEKYETYIEYGLLIFGIFPLIAGLTRFCWMKHKTLKKLQITLGIILIIIGGPIMDPVQVANQPVQEENIELGADITIPEAPHNPGWVVVLLGLIPLFMGITGKGTYSHCIKYKEKITKIRV